MDLNWCFQPGVKLDFRHLPDGYVVQAADVEAELARIGHTLQPLQIVVVNTRAGSAYGTAGYTRAGCGMGYEATMYLLERGVRLTGTDAWSWDAPFAYTAQRYAESGDASLIWEGHKAGRDIGYCHLEKLHNLEALPASGFYISCFPVKVRGASAGWTRAVAIFDPVLPLRTRYRKRSHETCDTARTASATAAWWSCRPMRSRCIDASPVAPTLLDALERWDAVVEPALARLSVALNIRDTRLPALGAMPFDARECSAPLPRTWQWLDGSAFSEPRPPHGARVQGAARRPTSRPFHSCTRAQPTTFWVRTTRCAPAVRGRWQIDFEGEFGVVLDETPMGVTARSMRCSMCASSLLHQRLEPARLWPARGQKRIWFSAGQALHRLCARGRHPPTSWARPGAVAGCTCGCRR